VKAYLEKVVSDKEAQIADLAKRSETSESIEEVRAIEKQIVALKDEIAEARAQMSKLDAEVRAKTEFQPMKALESVEMKSAQKDDDEMEYRKAFMAYAQKGEMSPILKRSDDRITSGDLGVMVPQTVMNEIIKGVEKKYGQLYGRVRKTSIKGGVKYPIGAFSATFHRLTEESTGAAPSARQAAGAITGYVEFSYNIGEIRIATSLLASVLEVPAFEREVINTIVEGYVKAMDKEIMTGVAASHQCVGILTEAAASPSRIPAGNTIEFTAAEIMDWKEWQSKLFAKIPLGMRGERPEFVMSAGTYESVIKCLADDNDRPVYYETFNPIDGTETATFKGREVVFVEEDIFKTFGDIDLSGTDSPYFGMLWVPQKAYAINSNMEFFVKRYFDEEKNEWIDKALVINDGKVLDGEYIYLLKKVASS
jgi:HK97 family phage major capsid protein